MNEKIYAIARRADTLAREIEPDLREIVRYNRIRDEKFAELIVRECIDWIDGSPTTEEGSLILSKHFIIANLKQHFGVEE